MTKIKVLKQFFKKFFNIDAHGNSVAKVIDDVVQNNDSLGMTTGTGASDILICHGVAVERPKDIPDDIPTRSQWQVNQVDLSNYKITLDKTYREVSEFMGRCFLSVYFENQGYEFGVMLDHFISSGEYHVGCTLYKQQIEFLAESEDEYLYYMDEADR